MFKHHEEKLDTEIQNLFKERGSLTQGEKSELAGLALALHKLPKKQVPVPNRRRLYINELASLEHETSFSKFRILILGASGLLMLLVTVTGFAIYSSRPGTGLYSYKKTAERLQVNLSLGSEAKTHRELALAEKRLTEAREVIASNPDNAELTAAALTELTEQTDTAVALVEKAANERTSAATEEIAEKLNTLAKDQLALVSSIKENTNSAIETATTKAKAVTEETNKKVANIREIIAANNEEIPAVLETIPEALTGIVTAIGTNTITVDKTVIEITKDTVIEWAEAHKSKPSVVLKAKVTVTAVKKEGVLLAEKIIIESVPVNDKDIVKKPAEQDKLLLPPPPEDSVPKPSASQGTFIREDPAPQPIE